MIFLQKNVVLISIIFLSLHFSFSCKSSYKRPVAVNLEGKKIDLHDIKKGMSPIEVMKILGLPTEKNLLGSVVDEKGNQTITDYWKYGSNAAITFVNDSVNFIDYDIISSTAHVQHIIDSAKAVEDKR